MASTSQAQILPTVSRAFIDDWLAALRAFCPPQQFADFLEQAGLSSAATSMERITHDQIVLLYQVAAVQTGDEMMGLWSRPIRPGALKHLCTSTRHASSLSASLYRFTTFWNLLLDDYSLSLDSTDNRLRISLSPRDDRPVNRFGHMLMLKLAHGVASWLAGRELILSEVRFAFQQPEFAEDYPILFPAQIRFGQMQSSIEFGSPLDDTPMARSEVDMREFLKRAPRDWIFTTYREHAMPLQVREMLLRSDHLTLHLDGAAKALNMSPRTLIRRLDRDGASFQTIKDGLRRDIAIRDLELGGKSIEAISQDLGFASAANFHRAFKQWTNMTPGTYRRLTP